MPYKTEKLKLPREMDARVKLTFVQKEEIKYIRENMMLSYRVIAEAYGVSKKLVIMICNPDIADKNKEQYKERRQDGRYYKRDKHTKAVRKHRKRKHNLLKDNNEQSTL